MFLKHRFEYSDENSVNSKVKPCIYFDETGVAWAGTYGGNLKNKKLFEFNPYRRNDIYVELVSGSSGIYSIEKDGKGINSELSNWKEINGIRTIKNSMYKYGFTGLTGSSAIYSATWDIYYRPVNTKPTISGKDQDLGNISDEINYKYTVFDEDNDILSVVERLNNTVTNVRNDVKSGTEFTLNIPKEDIYKLPIGQTNKISIEVSDGQEKVYRNLTFVRTNTAPVIQVLSEQELGDIITPFTSKVKVTDEEGDKVDLLYTTNQILLDKNNDYKRVTIHTDTKNDIKLGTEISYSIPAEIFKRMNIGKYELSIKAIDAEQGENEEIITFSRTEDTIDFETKPVATETMPKQFISLIQVVGNPKHSKIMACNNGLDTKPNWEDITKFALDGSPYTFKNTIKTAAKWAVKIKVNIDGKEVK